MTTQPKAEVPTDEHKLTEPERVRFRRGQLAKLRAEADDRGVSMAEVVRMAVDEFFGRKTAVDRVELPSTPPVPLVVDDASYGEVEVASIGRTGTGMDDDYRSGLTPPPTQWKDRQLPASRLLRVGVARCQCPAIVPMDGVVCSGCGLVR